MNLIDLYTREVGRNLPEKMHADIEREIRSLIEDNLEDESQRTGRPVDEAMQVEILRRLGPPDKVAASYLPPRYLIGPELYPYFLTTLRIVLAVVAILAALGTGASLGVGSGTPQNVTSVIEVMARLFSGLLEAMISAAGTVVFIFAIIQIVSPNFKTAQKDQDWDPRKLLSQGDPERISVSGAITEIVFTSLALVVFNLYPQWVGFFTVNEQGSFYISILTEAFFRYLPWLSALWVLEICSNVWLVVVGRWTNTLRWAKIGLSFLSILVLSWMMVGPALVALKANEMAPAGWNLGAEALARINQGLQTGASTALGIVIAFEAVEIGKQLYKLFRQRLPAPLITNK